MYLFAPIVLAIPGWCVATAVGHDYILRIDKVGYIERPADEDVPPETILGTIELLARPDSAFHGKATIGPETLTLSGKLTRTEQGKYDFILRIHVVDTIDTGQTIPAADGGREPAYETTDMETIISVNLDDRIAVGGIDTTSGPSGKPTVKSKIRYIAHLARAPQEPIRNESEMQDRKQPENPGYQ